GSHQRQRDHHHDEHDADQCESVLLELPPEDLARSETDDLRASRNLHGDLAPGPDQAFGCDLHVASPALRRPRNSPEHTLPTRDYGARGRRSLAPRRFPSGTREGPRNGGDREAVVACGGTLQTPPDSSEG